MSYRKEKQPEWFQKCHMEMSEWWERRNNHHLSYIPESLFECPQCHSRWLSRNNSIMYEWMLDIKDSKIFCQKCGTPLPWLNHRTYGLSSMIIHQRHVHEEWLYTIFGLKRPLWMLTK